MNSGKAKSLKHEMKFGASKRENGDGNFPIWEMR
jgi:hypothetical protein